jgi:hypothetical protein
VRGEKEGANLNLRRLLGIVSQHDEARSVVSSSMYTDTYLGGECDGEASGHETSSEGGG